MAEEPLTADAQLLRAEPWSPAKRRVCVTVLDIGFESLLRSARADCSVYAPLLSLLETMDVAWRELQEPRAKKIGD